MKIVQAEGQTGNQFWIYINYIADSLATGEKIAILAPDISICDYPNFYDCNNISFPLYFKSLEGILGYKKYIKILNNVFANKYSKYLLKIFFNLIPKVQYIDASVFCPKSKYRIQKKEQLKFIFKPHQTITSSVEEFFINIKQEFDLIIGVHIRLGDYKSYLDGRYYYSMIQYHNVMLSAKTLFPNKKIGFFISSNEKIDLDSFSDCSCFVIPKSTAIKDLYGLSLSDYIFGPPSTFSAWASYYGNVPLYFVENPDKMLNVKDFIDILSIWS